MRIRGDRTLLWTVSAVVLVAGRCVCTSVQVPLTATGAGCERIAAALHRRRALLGVVMQIVSAATFAVAVLPAGRLLLRRRSATPAIQAAGCGGRRSRRLRDDRRGVGRRGRLVTRWRCRCIGGSARSGCVFGVAVGAVGRLVGADPCEIFVATCGLVCGGELD